METLFGLILEDLGWGERLSQVCRDAGIEATLIDGSIPVLRTAAGDIPIGYSNYSPGVAIALETLHREFRTKEAYRIGTCGGYPQSCSVGDIVLSTGALRGEGTSHCYVEEPTFPAVPNFICTQSLSDALEIENCRVWRGLIWTTDGRIVGQYEPARVEKMLRWGVFGVDMETSAFFVVSHVLGIGAASMSVVVDLPGLDGEFAPVLAGREEKVALGLYRCFRVVPELIRKAIGQRKARGEGA